MNNSLLLNDEQLACFIRATDFFDGYATVVAINKETFETAFEICVKHFKYTKDFETLLPAIKEVLRTSFGIRD